MMYLRYLNYTLVFCKLGSRGHDIINMYDLPTISALKCYLNDYITSFIEI